MKNKKKDIAVPEEMEFNLSDFALFLSVMKNRNAYENTLSIIMDEPALRLKEVRVEEVILNRSGKRAIRLDVWGLDIRNRQFNTEMQNDLAHDDIRKRSRFYQSLLDTPVLKSGKQTRYKNLPSTVIIFITQEDIFGRNLVKYTFTEQCEEVEELCLEDGTKKIFLNMSVLEGRPELVSLLQYMKETNLKNPNIQVRDRRLLKLDSVVQEVKQSEEWEAVKMSILSVGIEKGRAEGIEKGIRKGIKKGIKKGVKKGIAKGRAEGMIKGILDLLSELGPVPDELQKQISSEANMETLGRWLKKAAKADSIEGFEKDM